MLSKLGKKIDARRNKIEKCKKENLNEDNSFGNFKKSSDA